ncbi:MAG: hypothetical protein MJY69_02280 [Bacteroidales bacterium]|nr:hypothetical protein [Bacteroidales bacterium]
MLKRYIAPSLFVLEAVPGQSILVGSIIPTTTEVIIPVENVTVSEFKEDEEFEENNFGDISF